MAPLLNLLQTRSEKLVSHQPVFFNVQKTQDQKKLETLLHSNTSITVTDTYESQLRELFVIQNPHLAQSPTIEQLFTEYKYSLSQKKPLFKHGSWVYFPWLNSVVHILSEPDFFTVRTARNKLLITEKEQIQFYNAPIGIAGLSVGNSVATALVLQGGAKYIRLADFDTLDLSNTNRVRAGVQNLGLKKTEMTARQIYEMNPYARITLLSGGLTPKNITAFTKGLSVIVDEMDNLSLKLELRVAAKKQRIPIVMGADNDNMAVVDIERYDKKQPAFFHGRLNNHTKDSLEKLTKFEIGRTIAGLIGLENHTPRMLNSLMGLGKTIVSWPQLGGTAMLNGAAVAYCVRSIACNLPLEDNRGIVSMEEIFQKNFSTKGEKENKAKAIKTFKHIFKL